MFLFREQIECHKTCESQRLELKRKIKELQQCNALSTSTNRIIAESPAPLKKFKNCIDSETVDSPTVVSALFYIKIVVSNFFLFRRNVLHL